MSNDETLLQRHISRVSDELVNRELKIVRKKLKKDGFWFVDIPRTSSSSVRELIGTVYGFPHGKLTTGGQFKETPESFLLPNHLPARIVRAVLGKDIFDGLYSFAICRDPIDWSVSLWNYCVKYGMPGVSKELTYTQFLEILERNCAVPINERPAHPLSLMQSDYLIDDDGKLLIDGLIKFEHPSVDAELMQIIGKEHWKPRNRVLGTDGMSTRHSLSQDETDYAYSVFEKDMEVLGYKKGD